MCTASGAVVEGAECAAPDRPHGVRCGERSATSMQAMRLRGGGAAAEQSDGKGLKVAVWNAEENVLMRKACVVAARVRLSAETNGDGSMSTLTAPSRTSWAFWRLSPASSSCV